MKNRLLIALCAAALAFVFTPASRADDTRPGAPKPALPKLVDLGADKCIPCKQMKPILDEFMRDYADQFETVFIDVWKKPDEGRAHKIRLIPTQIFYDVSGKELARHEGFISKKDILAKWAELGITVREPAPKPVPAPATE
ncbi:thioredoxin family protein [Ereboglobus luteus]|uniref:Thiol reductase thioredoxin n=1 Tax=Ereboglobus luteus TaxID=1796921 RepID=A0A2U8E264_9BACT|nr:thioredoxin family protein [Ereboglobus luteus]AWI08784.1 thiol reductase thioredoxin [Ereboglobus luteus]